MRWRDLVKEDMVRNQMTTEMAEDRKHVMIQAGTLRSVDAIGEKVRSLVVVVFLGISVYINVCLSRR